jgi:hypothetical protein
MEASKPDSAEPGAEQKPAGAPAQPSWKAQVSFLADTINKAALPIVTAIVALAGTIITSKINESNSLRTTINQREQAETTLRSSMFKELVNPLLTPGDTPDVTRPQRLALLAELLALNFHEHFELGPLLTYVDELPAQTSDNRRRLRSAARRVIARQIAVLDQQAVRGGQCADTGVLASNLDIHLRSKSSEPTDVPQFCELTSTEGNQPVLDCSARANEKVVILKPFVVSSPDCNARFTVTLSDLDWRNHSVRVLMTSVDGDADRARKTGASQARVQEFIEFTLSQYALPYSDNTLLRDGNRFGIYMRGVEPSREPCTPPACDPSWRRMRLSLVWFPPDFIPPRERPTDFRRIRESLKM